MPNKGSRAGKSWATARRGAFLRRLLFCGKIVPGGGRWGEGVEVSPLLRRRRISSDVIVSFFPTAGERPAAAAAACLYPVRPSLCSDKSRNSSPRSAKPPSLQASGAPSRRMEKPFCLFWNGHFSSSLSECFYHYAPLQPHHLF